MNRRFQNGVHDFCLKGKIIKERKRAREDLRLFVANQVFKCCSLKKSIIIVFFLKATSNVAGCVVENNSQPAGDITKYGIRQSVQNMVGEN